MLHNQKPLSELSKRQPRETFRGLTNPTGEANCVNCLLQIFNMIPEIRQVILNCNLNQLPRKLYHSQKILGELNDTSQSTSPVSTIPLTNLFDWKSKNDFDDVFSDIIQDWADHEVAQPILNLLFGKRSNEKNVFFMVVV